MKTDSIRKNNVRIIDNRKNGNKKGNSLFKQIVDENFPNLTVWLLSLSIMLCSPIRAVAKGRSSFLSAA